MICPEQTLLLTGIGGQGVQLAAQVVARAAIAEGREVQLFGSYGGMMRGGETAATVVISDAPIESPPTVTDASSAILMHHNYVEPTLRRLAKDSVVIVNASIYDGPSISCGRRIDIRATDIALDLGNIQTASMVLLGAYAKATETIKIESLVDAVAGSLPSYRSDRAELNAAAVRAGYAA